MANPSDTSYAVIKEVTEGTTPATPAFLRCDHIPGNRPQYTSDYIDSPILKPARAAGAGRKAGFRVEGGLDFQVKRDAAVDVMLESLCSGTYSSNVLKGGSTNVSFTVEEKMVEGGTSLYKRFTGCQVQSMSLSCEASGNATASFSIMGMGSSNGTSIITGATYTNASSTLNLNGADVSVSVAGLTADFRSLELSVERPLEAIDEFGSTSAAGIRQGGARNVRLSLSFYRTDLSPETVLTGDTPIAVSFTIGSGANGYTFALPAATFTLPQDDEDGAKALVSVEFVGSYDTTETTDLKITRLT